MTESLEIYDISTDTMRPCTALDLRKIQNAVQNLAIRQGDLQEIARNLYNHGVFENKPLEREELIKAVGEAAIQIFNLDRYLPK